jgi:hypothetical protein
MSHTRTLIGTITDKARASWLAAGNNFNMNDGDGEYKRWEQHWLATARQWRDELQAEGLTDTVEALNKTITFFEKVGGSD